MGSSLRRKRVKLRKNFMTFVVRRSETSFRSGVQERVAMMISGHKTRSVFDRYNIIDESDLKLAVRKLQKFQHAAEPACQPAQAVSSAPADRPEFVN